MRRITPFNEGKKMENKKKKKNSKAELILSHDFFARTSVSLSTAG
jgi:hypothetical protein